MLVDDPPLRQFAVKLQLARKIHQFDARLTQRVYYYRSESGMEKQCAVLLLCYIGVQTVSLCSGYQPTYRSIDEAFT